jgi:hypothetical protein
VLGVKNCRSKDFNGKITVGPGDGFRYEANPNSQVSADISAWYELQDEGIFSTLPFLSGGGGNNARATLDNTPVMSLESGQAQARGKNGKPAFFMVR